MGSSDSYLDLRVRELLERVAERSPAPACGSASALVAALAAALAAMTARFAPEGWRPRASVVERAEQLKGLLADLADADAAAYAAFLAGGPREPTIEAPRRMGELAREAGALADRIAEEGNPNVAADARAAATLARAAAAIADDLVAVNSR